MAFVGRERELAQLAEAVRRVAEGGRGRVVLTAPAGMGSTRLLDELERRVAVVPGIISCRGRAYEPTSGVPYQAFGDALAAGLRTVDDDRLADVVGSVGHDLCAIVPGLAGRLDRLSIGRSRPQLEAPDFVGRRIVESLLGTLERLATDGVVLLVIEDIHRADPATRAFIEALHDVGRSLPVCLVVTYQPDELHRRHPSRALADRLADDPGVLHLELPPLNPADLERLVRATTGERAAGSLVTVVAEGARGDPLIAELLLSAAQLEGVRLSDPFEQLCGARLEALSRDAARAVRLLAAARQPLERSSLLAIRPPDGRITIAGLEEAEASGLVVHTGERYAAAHDLYAEAIEALELTPERQALHAAIAGHLEHQPALAAWHWVKAARPTQARAACLRAAELAAAVDPGETTLDHFERALELPAAPEASPEERAIMLAGAARASASVGSFRRAAALMRQAIESRATRSAARERGARDAATRTLLGEMHEELGRYEWAGGELAGALDSMERALGIMPDRPSRSRARAQATLAQYLMIDGRFEESVAVAEVACATARAAAAAGEDTLAEQGHATCTLGVDMGYLGRPERGLALLEEAAMLARRAGRLDDLMRVAANRTTLLDLDARREEALAVVQAGFADAAAGGLSATFGALLRGNAADILIRLGRWEEAERECRTALSWRTRRPEAAWFQPLLVLGLLLAESRADEEAASIIGQALLQLETVLSGQWTGLVLRAAVSLAIWTSEFEDALAIAEREWPRALATGEPAIVALAASTCLEAAAAAADHGRDTSDAGLIARARELAEVVLPQAQAQVARSTLQTGTGARVEAELALATARAHRSRVRGRSDARRWGELAEAWEARGIPYEAAKARWWQALAILSGAAEDERDWARVAARQPLAAAHRVARALPALPLLRAVVGLAVRARIALPSEAAPLAERAMAPTGIAAGATGSAVGTSEASPGAVATDEAATSATRLVAVGPGVAKSGQAGLDGRAPIQAVPVSVDPGRAPVDGRPASADIARAIEERVLAALRRGPVDAYGLSPREQEVLAILAEGRTDREIAGRLFISERTVHVHVRRILAKLGVASRTEAAGLAIRQGLVPMEIGFREVPVPAREPGPRQSRADPTRGRRMT